MNKKSFMLDNITSPTYLMVIGMILMKYVSEIHSSENEGPMFTTLISYMPKFTIIMYLVFKNFIYSEAYFNAYVCTIFRYIIRERMLCSHSVATCHNHIPKNVTIQGIIA